MRRIWTTAFVTVLTLCVGSQALAQDEANRPQAEQAFMRGVELANQERWEDALEQFNESLRLYPTQSALFNRALCLGLLGRPAEAVADLEEHTRLYGTSASAERRQEVADEMARLRRRVGTIEVRVDGAAEADVLLDGQEVGTAPLESPLVVNPGRHQVTVNPPDISPVSRWVTVGAGDEVSVVIAVGGSGAALGSIEVVVDVPDAAVRIDGALVGRSPLPEPVAATVGTHIIMVEAEGHEPARAEVDVSSGEVARVELSVTTGTSTTTTTTTGGDDDRRGMFIGAIVATAAGVAMLGTAMGLGIWNHGRYGDWETDDNEYRGYLDGTRTPPADYDLNRFPTDVQNHNNTGSGIESVDIATYVLYGVGGAAVAAGITLFVLRPILNRDTSVSLLPSPRGLVLAGTW